MWHMSREASRSVSTVGYDSGFQHAKPLSPNALWESLPFSECQQLSERCPGGYVPEPATCYILQSKVAGECCLFPCLKAEIKFVGSSWPQWHLGLEIN